MTIDIEAAIQKRLDDIATLRRARRTLKRLAKHDEWTDFQRSEFHHAQLMCRTCGVAVTSDFTFLADVTIK
jgi:hypothetical protein